MMLMQFYTAFLMDETVFPLDLDRLEMARTLIPNLDQGGNVQTVLDCVGGGLYGEPGGSMQVLAGGEHHLKRWACGYSLILAVR